MRALSPFLWGRPWQLFGLTLPKEGRDDPTASCGLFRPGPEPVCRARPVDSTTAHKIQGPELLAAPACSLTSLIASQQELRRVAGRAPRSLAPRAPRSTLPR